MPDTAPCSSYLALDTHNRTRIPCPCDSDSNLKTIVNTSLSRQFLAQDKFMVHLAKKGTKK
jgi:hypothetical protein